MDVQSRSLFGNLSSDLFNQAILDALVANIAVLDQQGNIVAVNQAWKRFAQENGADQDLHGCGVGTNYLEVFRRATPEDSLIYSLNVAYDGIISVLNGSQSIFSLEYACASPMQKRWFLMNVTPLPQMSGVVLAHIDITERKLAEEILRLDILQRKELEQRKDNFISMASHELKTPIMALRGLNYLLKKKLDRQNDHENGGYLSRMDEQITALTKLVEDLLDVSKMQVGVLDYAKDVLDLDALIHDSVQTVEQIMETHTIVVYGTSSCKIIGDRERLKQVFLNLLINAIKYSPQADKVDVAIIVKDSTVIISIRDYGVGIPSADQPKIFERFYRVLDSGRKKVSGLGMGLYIAREIVQQHGGQIWLESTEGEGSIFCVSLPSL